MTVYFKDLYLPTILDNIVGKMLITSIIKIPFYVFKSLLCQFQYGLDSVSVVMKTFTLQGGHKDDQPPPPPHRTSSLSPTKRQQPPPTPPQKSYPLGTEENEPPNKINKMDNEHNRVSPVKPPRVGLTEVNKGDNTQLPTDNAKTVLENNNPVHDQPDNNQSETAFTQESINPSNPESTQG